MSETVERRLTKEEIAVLAKLVDDGFAVVVFEPEELSGADPVEVEEEMIQRGWQIIWSAK